LQVVDRKTLTDSISDDSAGAVLMESFGQSNSGLVPNNFTARHKYNPTGRKISAIRG
jgi:hypothetical protein